MVAMKPKFLKTQIGIKMKLKKFKVILLIVFLMTGLSITGWAISTRYDQSLKSVEIQKELKKNSQDKNVLSGKFSNNSPILFLISTGLIGFLGIRRQRKKLDNLQSENTPGNENNRKAELSKQRLI